jgi:hypothetical protein
MLYRHRKLAIKEYSKGISVCPVTLVAAIGTVIPY